MKLPEILEELKERKRLSDKQWLRFTIIFFWVVFIFGFMTMMGYVIYGDTISINQYPDRTTVSSQLSISPVIFTENNPSQTINLSVTDTGFDQNRYIPGPTPGIFLTIYVNYSLPDDLPHSVLSPKWASNEVIDDSDHGTGSPFVGWYAWNKVISDPFIHITMTEMTALDPNTGLNWFIPASITSIDTYFSAVEAPQVSFRIFSALSVTDNIPVPEPIPLMLLIIGLIPVYLHSQRKSHADENHL